MNPPLHLAQFSLLGRCISFLVFFFRFLLLLRYRVFVRHLFRFYNRPK